MKTYIVNKNILLMVLLLWYLGSGLQYIYAQNMPVVAKNEEVKGFTMTIFDKGGKEKAAISGSVATMLPGGIVEIKDVVARVYGRETGGADTLVHTSKGVYNKFKNIVYTDEFVRINRDDIVITGTGLEWFPDKTKIIIKENVKVEYSFTLKDKQIIDSAEKRMLVITAQKGGFLDYNRNVAVFRKNVVVNDINATLKANRMKVFFDNKTQELNKVEAYGNVRIKQPKRESKSRKAIYYADEDKIELTGNPKIVQGLDFYTADKVTIFDKGNRVVFEPRAELIIYAEEHDVIGNEGI